MRCLHDPALLLFYLRQWLDRQQDHLDGKNYVRAKGLLDELGPLFGIPAEIIKSWGDNGC